MRIPLVLGALAVATTFSIGKAEAGHFHGSFHAGGGGHFSVHVGGSFHVGGPAVHMNFARPAYNWAPRRWGTWGHIYVGPRYVYRPYWYYGYNYYDYGYVPSYYGSTYYPVQAEPQYAGPSATVAVAAPARPELPRFGLGLFAGGASTDSAQTGDNNGSSDMGLLARFRLTEGLIVEGELGKTTYANDVRSDRRLGASLLYEFGAYNRLAPYVVAGAGVQESSTNDSYDAKQNFGEIGAGLRYAITPHFHLTGDIRIGERDTMSSTMDTSSLGGANATARSVAPPPVDSPDTTEQYTRARLAAVLYF